MAAHGQRLRLRLFLEGVEVPVISANIQTAPNCPVMASIQVPPLPEGTRLLPRTLVHLFFYDDYEAKLPFITPSSKASSSPLKSPTDYQRDQDRLNGPSDRQFNETISNIAGGSTAQNEAEQSTITQYKLLFGGEFIGFAWAKGQSQRALVLQCQDWSNYWDHAYQFTNTGIFGPGRQALFSGGASNLFTDFLSSNSSVVVQIVSSGRCNSFPQLGGLAAGIIRLMEAIGGIYYPNPNSKDKKAIAGQNTFFSLAELRLHVTHMVAAFEKDPTSRTLLRRDGWLGMFSRQLGGLGNQVSIRKAINALTGVIFHETYGQPCPYYKPGLDNSVDGQRRVKLKDSPEFNFIASGAEQLRDSAQTMLTALDADAQAVALAGGIEAYRDKIALQISLIKKFCDKLSANSATSKAPTSVHSSLSLASHDLAQVVTGLQNWRPGAPVGDKQAASKPLQAAIDLLNKVTNLTINATPKGLAKPARLNQHILRPDIWFGSPPRCNILFPDHYESLNYQRSLLEEPTRLLLKTNDEFFGEDFLFDKLYFAPQTGSIQKDKARMRDLMKGDLLDHELFTGVLPVFEKSGEFNIFASRSGTQGPAEKGQTSKSGFAQRSANFLYFKYRFASRQMRVCGRFNPYVACGFPGLVIDKYVDLSTLNQYNEQRNKQDLPAQKISEALGTNFLGNFTETSHMVSQSEARGRTEIVCSYPRQPEESVEFLGAVEKVQTIRTKTAEITRATDVAALNPPKLYSLGPNGGRITNVLDVTDSYFAGSSYSSKAPTSPKTLPLYSSKTVQQGRVQMPLVPVGVVTTARELSSPDVAESVGSFDREVMFRAFRIDESVPQYKRQTATPPAEELIRPGWYGDCWKPSRIGEAYNDFFGIGSITDAQVVTGVVDGQSTPDEKARAATDAAANPSGVDSPAFLTLDEGSSIQDAVDFLVTTYSYIKQNNLSVEDFIRSYVWRPIASMVDIFGTTDLEFSADGEVVLSGIEGFHSRAFGPYDNLFGLVSPEIESVLGIKRGSPAASRADTRRRKLEAVQQYAAALAFSRGLLG